MLAKNVRTPRGTRFPALSFTSIASVLAPTGECVLSMHKKAHDMSWAFCFLRVALTRRKISAAGSR